MEEKSANVKENDTSNTDAESKVGNDMFTIKIHMIFHIKYIYRKC